MDDRNTEVRETPFNKGIGGGQSGDNFISKTSQNTLQRLPAYICWKVYLIKPHCVLQHLGYKLEKEYKMNEQWKYLSNVQ